MNFHVWSPAFGRQAVSAQSSFQRQESAPVRGFCRLKAGLQTLLAASVLFTLFFTTGCKSTYSETNLTAEPPPLLRGTSRIYVAMPYDASFKKQVALNSGKHTAEALYVALQRYTRGVFMGRFPESAADATESARQHGSEYLIYPHIIKWEDRATEYSGVRDRLELKIDLINVADGKLAFSRDIAATGKWLTEGGDKPDDLLQQPIEEYVNALFRKVERPSAY
jgi:hypothetical protein